MHSRPGTGPRGRAADTPFVMTSRQRPRPVSESQAGTGLMFAPVAVKPTGKYTVARKRTPRGRKEQSFSVATVVQYRRLRPRGGHVQRLAPEPRRRARPQGRGSLAREVVSPAARPSGAVQDRGIQRVQLGELGQPERHPWQLGLRVISRAQAAREIQISLKYSF